MKGKTLCLIFFLIVTLNAQNTMDNITELLLKNEKNDAYKILESWQPQSYLQNFFYHYANCALRIDKGYSAKVLRDAAEHMQKAEEFMRSDFNASISELKKYYNSLPETDKEKIIKYEHSRWQKTKQEFISAEISKADSLYPASFFIIYRIMVNLKLNIPQNIIDSYLLFSTQYDHYLYHVYPIFYQKFSSFSDWSENLSQLEDILIALCDMACMQPNIELQNDVSSRMTLATQNNPYFDNPLFTSKIKYIIHTKYILPEVEQLKTN